MKNMTAHKFGGKEEQWHKWQEEARGYIDATKTGMKTMLMEVEKEGTGAASPRPPCDVKDNARIFRSTREGARIVSTVGIIWPENNHSVRHGLADCRIAPLHFHQDGAGQSVSESIFQRGSPEICASHSDPIRVYRARFAQHAAGQSRQVESALSFRVHLGVRPKTCCGLEEPTHNNAASFLQPCLCRFQGLCTAARVQWTCASTNER